MKCTRPQRIRVAAWLLNVATFGLAACALGLSLPVLFRRMLFPGVLEHQESFTVFLLHRLSESPGNFYDMPTLTTGSVIYNPAYYFYLWTLRPLIGDHLAAIRVASVIPFLIASGVLIEIVGRRRLDMRGLGLAWGCVTLAFYPAATWIDLARMEAMLLFSIVLLLFTLCLDDAWRPKFVLVGLVVVISFSIKQPGALLAATPLALAITDRRYLVSVAVAVAGMVLFVGAMYLAFGQNYVYWTFTRPGMHAFEQRLAMLHFANVVSMAPLLIVSPVLLFIWANGSCSVQTKFLVLLGTTFIICALGAGKAGGGPAQYVLLLYLTAIPAAMFIVRGLRAADALAVRVAMATLVTLAYSAAMIRATGADRTSRPGRDDRYQQQTVLEVVCSVPGESWVTTWPHIDLRAGQPVKNTLRNLLAGSGNASPHQKVDLPALACEKAISDRRFAVILTTNEFESPFQELLAANYVHCGSLPMRGFGHRMFLPTEVWARSEDDRQRILAVFKQRGVANDP